MTNFQNYGFGHTSFWLKERERERERESSWKSDQNGIKKIAKRVCYELAYETSLDVLFKYVTLKPFLLN